MNTIYNTLRTDKGYKVYEGYLYEITGEEYIRETGEVAQKFILDLLK